MLSANHIDRLLSVKTETDGLGKLDIDTKSLGEAF